MRDSNTCRVSWGSWGAAGEGGVGAPARILSARSSFNFSSCSTTISWYRVSLTASTQCFFSSVWNSSLLSRNFLFLPSYFSSIVVNSASSFFWCIVRLWTCLRNTWKQYIRRMQVFAKKVFSGQLVKWHKLCDTTNTCILAVVTTLRTSGTIVSPKISLIKRWFLMNLGQMMIVGSGQYVYLAWATCFTLSPSSGSSSSSAGWMSIRRSAFLPPRLW